MRIVIYDSVEHKFYTNVSNPEFTTDPWSAAWFDTIKEAKEWASEINNTHPNPLVYLNLVEN